MTRDGTVGRSDATETNLAFHRDIDPVRMMRTRFADPIRASSLFGLHQQAGHMTASDPLWRASKDLLPGGGHPHMRRREFVGLFGGAVAWPIAAGAQQPGKLPTIGFFGANTPAIQIQWTNAFVHRLSELG